MATAREELLGVAADAEHVEHVFNFLGHALRSMADQPPRERVSAACALAVDMVMREIFEDLSGFEWSLRHLPDDPSIPEVYCVAVPRDHFDKPWSDEIRFPWDIFKTPAHALFICTDTDQQEALFRRYDLTPERNLRRLAHAGVVGPGYGC